MSQIPTNQALSHNVPLWKYESQYYTLLLTAHSTLHLTLNSTIVTVCLGTYVVLPLPVGPMIAFSPVGSTPLDQSKKIHMITSLNSRKYENKCVQRGTNNRVVQNINNINECVLSPTNPV